MAENKAENPIDELVDAAREVINAWAGGWEPPRARLITAVGVVERVRYQARRLK
jgi:hypothetical protein